MAEQHFPVNTEANTYPLQLFENRRGTGVSSTGTSRSFSVLEAGTSTGFEAQVQPQHYVSQATALPGQIAHGCMGVESALGWDESPNHCRLDPTVRSAALPGHFSQGCSESDSSKGAARPGSKVIHISW
jgi:hypothetical protein